MKKLSVAAIIVAAGSSNRMGGIDKLFAPLNGRALLAYSLSAFQTCAAVEAMVLVLSRANLERGRRLTHDEGFHKVKAICIGGERRQDSVQAGLWALPLCQWVVVHDGARPLVTPDLIQQGLEAAQSTGAAVAALPVADTVKETGDDGLVSRTLPRQALWLAQTPQVFRYDLLLAAHQQVHDDAPDDAAMVERLGHSVKVFMGMPHNLKVTSPQDLALAEALLSRS